MTPKRMARRRPADELCGGILREAMKAGLLVAISQHVDACPHCRAKLLQALEECPQARGALLVIREKKVQAENVYDGLMKLFGEAGRLFR